MQCQQLYPGLASSSPDPCAFLYEVLVSLQGSTPLQLPTGARVTTIRVQPLFRVDGDCELDLRRYSRKQRTRRTQCIRMREPSRTRRVNGGSVEDVIFRPPPKVPLCVELSQIWPGQVLRISIANEFDLTQIY